MPDKQRALDVIHHRSTGHGVFWTGHPNAATIPIYAKEWGVAPTAQAIHDYLRDDYCWVMANSGYRHPQGHGEWDAGWGIQRGRSLSAEGCFAHAECAADIEKYPWPEPGFYDFSGVYAEIDRHPDRVVFSGLWCPFFHVLSDFFGMENYFVKMYDDPALVECVTERVVDCMVAANDKFFAGAGERAEVMFFGNDFGTQRDLFLSPENFRRFILPSLKKLIAVGKRYNRKIMLHSCGSIYRVIPDLIDAGVDMLHPIQAQAAGMSAKALAQYKNNLTFCGGIDAQSFLATATPRQIEDEVERVYDILGPNIIISPSHEEILPNVPAANMLAMSRAAHRSSASCVGSPPSSGMPV